MTVEKEGYVYQGVLAKLGHDFRFEMNVLEDERMDMDDPNSPRMIRFWTWRKDKGADEWHEEGNGSYCTCYADGQQDLCREMLQYYGRQFEQGTLVYSKKTMEQMSWGLDEHRDKAAFWWPHKMGEIAKKIAELSGDEKVETNGVASEVKNMFPNTGLRRIRTLRRMCEYAEREITGSFGHAISKETRDFLLADDNQNY